jgi:hypothetical protein
MQWELAGALRRCHDDSRSPRSHLTPPSRAKGEEAETFFLTIGIKAFNLPHILPVRVRRVRAAGRRGKDRCLTNAGDGPASGSGLGDPGPDGRKAYGLQEFLNCECLLSAGS